MPDLRVEFDFRRLERIEGRIFDIQAICPTLVWSAFRARETSLEMEGFAIPYRFKSNSFSVRDTEVLELLRYADKQRVLRE
jgi:hypothetical protein